MTAATAGSLRKFISASLTTIGLSEPPATLVVAGDIESVGFEVKPGGGAPHFGHLSALVETPCPQTLQGMSAIVYPTFFRTSPLVWKSHSDLCAVGDCLAGQYPTLTQIVLVQHLIVAEMDLARFERAHAGAARTSLA